MFPQPQSCGCIDLCVVAVILGMATASVAGVDSIACVVCGVAADAIADGDVGFRCRGGCVVVSAKESISDFRSQIAQVVRGWNWCVVHFRMLVDVAEDDS